MNKPMRTPLVAGPARFSTAEFLRMVETGAFDNIKVELIEGALERMPPPGNTHSRLQAVIFAQLLRFFPVELLRAEAGIDLGKDTIVGCDNAVLNKPVDSEGMIPAAAVALAVEIAVSTRDRDLDLKRRLYAAAGVPVYWVVDADRRVVHLFDRPERGDYQGLALARFGEPIAVPGAEETVVVG